MLLKILFSFIINLFCIYEKFIFRYWSFIPACVTLIKKYLHLPSIFPIKCVGGQSAFMRE